MKALLAVVVGVLAAVVFATPAGAHASLIGGSISDGQVLDTAPEEVLLTFNEPVSTTRSGVRVFDPAGDRVDVGGTVQDPDDAAQVRVALQDGLGQGTHAVTYRIVSADGHTVSGAFVFSIQTGSGAGEELLASVFAGDADRPFAIAAAVTRWVMYVSTLLAAGIVIVAWWLRREIAEEEGVALAGVVARAAWAVLAAVVVGLALQAILTTGDGLASLADGGALTSTATSFYGISAGVRAIGAVVLLLTARRGAIPAAAGLAGAALVLSSLLLEGHTLTSAAPAVMWPATAVHVLTAATWFGGLVVLWLVLRRRRRADDPIGAARLVARFSALFTASIVAVVLAGSAMAWVEVRALRAVLSTTYGLVLTAKVAVVLPLIGLGLYNNRRLVPVLTARRSRQRASQPVLAGGSDEAGASRRDAAWGHLRRTVGIEVAIITLVLGLTGVLVALQPAAVAAGVTGAYSENVPFDDIGQMTITVDPNRAGRNEIHLYLLGDTGRPVDVAESVELRLLQPDLDIGPIIRDPVIAGPGHYLLTGPELSVPGRWEITVEVALNRFDVVSTTVEVTVND